MKNGVKSASMDWLDFIKTAHSLTLLQWSDSSEKWPLQLEWVMGIVDLGNKSREGCYNSNNPLLSIASLLKLLEIRRQ